MDYCIRCDEAADDCSCYSSSYTHDGDIVDEWSGPAPDNVVYVDFVAKRRVA
jgi:hypothetical protein